MPRREIPKREGHPRDIEGLQTWSQGDVFPEIYAGRQDEINLENNLGLNGNWYKIRNYVNKLREDIDNWSASIPDADVGQSGKVSASNQAFSGLKTFTDNIAVGVENTRDGKIQFYNRFNALKATLTVDSITDEDKSYILPNADGDVHTILVDSDLNDALSEHNNSADHDHRYYTKEEVDSHKHSEYVDISTDQTIDGNKKFAKDITIDKGNKLTSYFIAKAKNAESRFAAWDYNSYQALAIQLKKNDGNMETVAWIPNDRNILYLSRSRINVGKNLYLATEKYVNEYVQDRIKTGFNVLTAQTRINGIASNVTYHFVDSNNIITMFPLIRACTIREWRLLGSCLGTVPAMDKGVIYHQIGQEEIDRTIGGYNILIPFIITGNSKIYFSLRKARIGVEDIETIEIVNMPCEHIPLQPSNTYDFYLTILYSL